MDSISGSTESLVNLGTSMQDAQLKNCLLYTSDAADE